MRVALLWSAVWCASCASVGPGRLDPALVTKVGSLPGVRKVELRAGADGVFKKVEIYHQSADEVPRAVREAAAARFPGSKVREYELEQYADATWVHEVELTTSDGRECELSATAAGVVRYTECKVAFADLPTVVKQKVDELLPGATVTEAEKKEGAGFDELSVEAKLGDVEHYLRLSPQGELLGRYVSVPAVLQVPRP